MEAHCDRILGDANLHRKLKKEKYDVVLVDLLYNECSMALAHELVVPVVGYWSFPLGYYIVNLNNKITKQRLNRFV
jgi:hypothetical protein